MRKISQARYDKLQGKKPTKAAPAPPKKKEAAPKKEVGMASMQTSMKQLEAQASATNKVIAHNSLVIEDFRKDLKEAVSSVGKRVPYVHDVERDKNDRISRITSTPQEK